MRSAVCGVCACVVYRCVCTCEGILAYAGCCCRDEEAEAEAEAEAEEEEEEEEEEAEGAGAGVVVDVSNMASWHQPRTVQPAVGPATQAASECKCHVQRPCAPARACPPTCIAPSCPVVWWVGVFPSMCTYTPIIRVRAGVRVFTIIHPTYHNAY